jgi:hypothetical protein
VKRILDQYFEALRAQDWQRLASCVAEDVHRTGPYLDDVRGRQAYVDFLAKVIPTLKNYDLKVSRVRVPSTGSAVVELSEFADVSGVRTEYPEVILFDFDAANLIARIDIYIKQVATRARE